ncbi:TATA box-binding protein-like 1 [Haliotis rufescens]|uniref:TATA box-binding protein-like 1 n=1 Tax=Haliotis rufescens TaxID=6454 RepID=UPI001EB082A0|nr:TATA box-binding protein-like 1 [Haliotis rufescens]
MATETLYPPGVLEPGEIPPELLNGLMGNGNGAEHVDDEPVVDITINNVVCSFNTRCHLNLKRIALEGCHVEYKQEQGMLNMKLRRPYTTASIWSSGKITCTGATSEDDSHRAGRRIARRLQRLGFNVRFTNFRVVNVLGTCSLPFGIKITNFSKAHREEASYEPELHPGVTYRIKDPKATLKIFSTGSITVTAPSVANVQSAIEHIYPLVVEHKAEETEIDRVTLLREKRFLEGSNAIVSARNKGQRCFTTVESEEDEALDTSDDSFDSEESQD